MPPSPYIHIMPLANMDYNLADFLKPSDPKRDFFAPNFYRCLPLTAANSLGWTLYNPFRFQVRWKGGNRREATEVQIIDGPEGWANSWFGHGTFTINPGFLVETSPGIDLLIRPIPNHFKLPVLTLEGIVETDWLKPSFTLNFRMMLPMISATYEVGEPLVQLVPYPREFIEDFETLIVSDGDDYRQRMNAYSVWNEKRGHQKDASGHYHHDFDYMRGVDVGQEVFSEHKKVFKLSKFVPRQDDTP